MKTFLFYYLKNDSVHVYNLNSDYHYIAKTIESSIEYYIQV